VSGPGSDEVASQLRTVAGLTVGGGTSDHLVSAVSWDRLGAALIGADRPKGSRVRVAVDPPRV